MASAIRLPAADTLDSSDEAQSSCTEVGPQSVVLPQPEEEVEDVGSVQPPAEQAEQAGPEASKARCKSLGLRRIAAQFSLGRQHFLRLSGPPS